MNWLVASLVRVPVPAVSSLVSVSSVFDVVEFTPLPAAELTAPKTVPETVRLLSLAAF